MSKKVRHFSAEQQRVMQGMWDQSYRAKDSEQNEIPNTLTRPHASLQPFRAIKLARFGFVRPLPAGSEL